MNIYEITQECELSPKIYASKNIELLMLERGYYRKRAIRAVKRIDASSQQHLYIALAKKERILEDELKYDEECFDDYDTIENRYDESIRLEYGIYDWTKYMNEAEKKKAFKRTVKLILSRPEAKMCEPSNLFSYVDRSLRKLSGSFISYCIIEWEKPQISAKLLDKLLA